MNVRDYRFLVNFVAIVIIVLFVGQLLLAQPVMSNDILGSLKSENSNRPHADIDGAFNVDELASQEVLNEIVWLYDSTRINVTQVTVNTTIITINSTKFVIENYENTTSISINDTVFLFFNASGMLFNFTYVELDGTMVTLVFQQLSETIWWFSLRRNMIIISEGYLQFSSDMEAIDAFMNLDMLIYPQISTPDKISLPIQGATRFNYTVTRDTTSVNLLDDKNGNYTPLFSNYFELYHDLSLDGSPNDEFGFGNVPTVSDNVTGIFGSIIPFTNVTNPMSDIGGPDPMGDMDGYDFRLNTANSINDTITGTTYTLMGGARGILYNENRSDSFIMDALNPNKNITDLTTFRGLFSFDVYNVTQEPFTIVDSVLLSVDKAGVSISVFDLFIFVGWDKVVIDYAFVVSLTIYLLVYQLEIVFFEITIVMYMFVTELLFVLIFYEFKLEVYLTQIIIKYLWVTITLVFISIDVLILYILILWIQITIKIVKKVIVPWWPWWPWWWWPVWIIFVPVPITIPKPVRVPTPNPIIIKLLDIDLINETYGSNNVTYQFLVRDSLGVNVTGATVTLSNGTLTKTATEVGNGVYEVTYPLSDPSKPMNFTVVASVAGLPNTTLKFHVNHFAPVSTTTQVVNQTITINQTVTTTTTVTVTGNQSATQTSTTQTTSQITPSFTMLSALLATIGILVLRYWRRKEK